jgi:hypothetical protein
MALLLRSKAPFSPSFQLMAIVAIGSGARYYAHAVRLPQAASGPTKQELGAIFSRHGHERPASDTRDLTIAPILSAPRAGEVVISALAFASSVGHAATARRFVAVHRESQTGSWGGRSTGGGRRRAQSTYCPLYIVCAHFQISLTRRLYFQCSDTADHRARQGEEIFSIKILGPGSKSAFFG